MIKHLAIAVAILAGAILPARAAEPQQISFAEAVGIALERNSTLARASNANTLDRLAITQAQMAFLPDLRFSLSGSQSYTRAKDETGSGVDVSWSGSAGAGLSSSLTLFNGLSNVAGLQAAQQEAAAGLLDMERTRQTIVFEVITGYLSLIEATEQLRVREENHAAQQEQERLVGALVEAGERPISDLYQQQAGVASARLALVEARRSVQLSNIDLVQALQLDPTGDYVFDVPPLPAGDRESVELDAAALVAHAFESRPDLGALANLHAAAVQGEREARAGRWPKVSLSADVGAHYSQNRDGDLLEQFGDQQSGSIGLSASLPLFDRRATSLDIERAQIQTENVELSLADLRQDVALQVKRAVLDWHSAAERLVAAEAQVRASQQALDATRERYEVGAATLVEVTLARADLVSATSTRVSARYALLWQARLLDYYVGDLDPAEGLLGMDG